MVILPTNQKMYVLDEGFNQQPIGVPGNLYGGVGVAKGYINDPERLITALSIIISLEESIVRVTREYSLHMGI